MISADGCTQLKGISPTLNLCRVDHSPKIVVLGRAEFIKGHDLMKRIYSVTGLAPTVNAHPGGHTEAKIQMYARIRRLIPLECWRLMGFSDSDFYTAKALTSDTQLYKQAGNSIVVKCLKRSSGTCFLIVPPSAICSNMHRWHPLKRQSLMEISRTLGDAVHLDIHHETRAGASAQVSRRPGVG